MKETKPILPMPQHGVTRAVIILQRGSYNNTNRSFYDETNIG
jgi:hypothetical protein